MYQERIQSLISTLKKEDTANLLVSDPANIYYLLGYKVDPGERLLLLTVRSNGKLSLYLNKLFPTYDKLDQLNSLLKSFPILTVNQCCKRLPAI